MPVLIKEDPELYVIYVMRDPRDVIVSRHGKNKSIYYSNIRLWRQMHAYAKQMAGHERFLEVRYEDFVRDPDSTQQMIAEKFPWLEKTHNFSKYHEYAQISEKSITAMHSVRPIAPTSVGVWTQHPGRIKGQQMIHGSLSPELIECGYESSADWEQVLNGVEPDFSKSLYPEKLYFWSRISQYINALRKVAKYRRIRRSA